MTVYYPIAHPIAPVCVSHYATRYTRVVVTGKKGSAPGELYNPNGVAIHEETHQIFIANWSDNRIEIFYESEEFFHQLGVGQLSTPWYSYTRG